MGFDIGLKLNKEITSDELRKKLYSYENEKSTDNICCLSRGFCNMVLSQFIDDESIMPELSGKLNFDCSFLEEPKANHIDEDDETKFQFGWVDSSLFLENLKELKKALDNNPTFYENLDLEEDWQYYFNKENEDCFYQDIQNIIEILEVANNQGVTELCYTIG